MDTAVTIDPEGFPARVSQYLEWLKVSYFSEDTAQERAVRLKRLVGWCLDRGITRPTEVTKPILEKFQSSLFYHRKANGQPLSLTTQRNFLTSMKGFFKWLAQKNHLLYNPASEILLPRLQKRLPRHVLSQCEAERVIAIPDVGTPLGIRDRAILEILYSTGIRRMELIALKLYDLDPDRGTLMVREGKGRRQRTVPIGERALRWTEKYLREIRPTLAPSADDGYIFLTHKGSPFEADSMTEHVRIFVERAEIPKHGAVHLFRHTMATLMLEGGADIRFIQAMLGHAKLETTQIYTQVSIRQLKAIHDATHPARMKRSRKKKGEGDADVPGE
jgi:integrase/recombinase XerD